TDKKNAHVPLSGRSSPFCPRLARGQQCHRTGLGQFHAGHQNGGQLLCELSRPGWAFHDHHSLAGWPPRSGVAGATARLCLRYASGWHHHHESPGQRLPGCGSGSPGTLFLCSLLHPSQRCGRTLRMSTPLNSSRRQWLSRVGKTSVAGLALSTLPVYARSSSAHVVVVGGGFGGATAARYLKRGDPSLKVTL